MEKQQVHLVDLACSRAELIYYTEPRPAGWVDITSIYLSILISSVKATYTGGRGILKREER